MNTNFTSHQNSLILKKTNKLTSTYKQRTIYSFYSLVNKSVFEEIPGPDTFFSYYTGIKIHALTFIAPQCDCDCVHLVSNLCQPALKNVDVSLMVINTVVDEPERNALETSSFF